MDKKFKKVFRYLKIYGFFRTLSKVVGRIRPKVRLWFVLKFPFYSRRGMRIGIIGCGQHAFSSIAYYLTVYTDSRLVFALDVDHKAASSLAYAYGAHDIGSTFSRDNSDLKVPDMVYISSNHSSHTDYAIKFMKYGCDVFVEKPLAISFAQLDELSKAVNMYNKKIYVGYNRPFSKAVAIVKNNISDYDSPFTLACFITGHFIADDHWYRDPSEGTRIVANLGHWIDLSVHMLSWADCLPSYLNVSISYSKSSTPSDNISVSITSSRNDLISLIFTSRSEPFEGVNETINFQQGDLIAKIDDFRVTKIWKRDQYRTYKHWPKNNGHKSCVLQPFNEDLSRSWGEVYLSTKLMLHIENMVKLTKTSSRFDF